MEERAETESDRPARGVTDSGLNCGRSPGPGCAGGLPGRAAPAAKEIRIAIGYWLQSRSSCYRNLDEIKQECALTSMEWEDRHGLRFNFAGGTGTFNLRPW